MAAGMSFAYVSLLTKKVQRAVQVEFSHFLSLA